MKEIAIVVLAAGKSTRMNRIKQLVKIGNNFLLESVLKKAKEINRGHVYCVLGANAKKIKQEISTNNIHFIQNNNYNSGLSSSIKAVVNAPIFKYKSYNGILFLLGDQPAIEKTYLINMITYFKENSTAIIASRYTNKVGVPVIIPKQYFKDLALLRGDVGAQQLLNKLDNVIAFKETTNFTDIDTEEDLETFKNMLLNK